MQSLEKMLEEYEKMAVPDEKIDLSDCPALTEEQLKNAKPLHPIKSKSNGKLVMMRMNNALAEHLEEIGDEWESKVNDVLMNAYAMGQI